MMDIVNAGIDSTNNVLRFCCLMLGQFPDIQADLRAEIEYLTDDYRNINMEMRKNCPRFLSFIELFKLVR